MSSGPSQHGLAHEVLKRDFFRTVLKVHDPAPSSDSRKLSDEAFSSLGVTSDGPSSYTQIQTCTLGLSAYLSGCAVVVGSDDGVDGVIRENVNSSSDSVDPIPDQHFPLDGLARAREMLPTFRPIVNGGEIPFVARAADWTGLD